MEDNTNNPVYSVGEFSHVIKKLVETNFSYVRIRGEISRPSFPGSGHVYFTLKGCLPKLYYLPFVLISYFGGFFLMGYLSWICQL